MTTTLLPTPPPTDVPARRPGRLRGALSTLAQLAVTPLVPADFVDLLAPLRSRANLRAQIVAILPETRDAATIVLRPGHMWRGHTAGQYVRLGVDVDGVRHWRAYSLTSSAAPADGCIRVTVKAVTDGAVSRHLTRDARPGDIVQLEQAAGDFTLPTVAPAKALFVVAGSGVTPVMGMLRSRVGDLDDAVVVLCARTVEDAIFLAELRELARDGQIRLVEHFTESGGRMTTAELATLVPDLADRQTWACGPAGLLDAIEEHWAASDLTDRLHVERFRSSYVEPGAGGTATFARSGLDVEVSGSTSLLDAGEAAGVLMPSGCRMGVCFGCVVPLRSGAVRDLRTGDVTQAQPGDDLTVQTCINTAATGCELDL